MTAVAICLLCYKQKLFQAFQALVLRYLYTKKERKKNSLSWTDYEKDNRGKWFLSINFLHQYRNIDVNCFDWVVLELRLSLIEIRENWKRLCKIKSIAVFKDGSILVWSFRIPNFQPQTENRPKFKSVCVGLVVDIVWFGIQS